MHWGFKFLLMGEFFSLIIWCAVAWLHGWTYQWYSNPALPGPMFQTFEFSVLEQIVMSSVPGFGFAAVLLGIMRFGRFVFVRWFSVRNDDPDASAQDSP